VSRAVLTFGRSRHALLFALLGLAPFGEAPLSEATVRQLLQAVELRAAAEARQKRTLTLTP